MTTRDSGPDSRGRLRGPARNALLAVSLTALSLTASGCVVVHGEREVLPATTRAEAAVALREFTAAYNKADKAYDSSLDAAQVTGALADIDGARLRAGHINSPNGNASHTPLTLTDATYTIPKKAGWPRWFLADARGNKGGDLRWLLVFTRNSPDRPWQAAYLTLVAPGKVPEFKKDKDGWAEAIPAASAGLAVAPQDLSKDYATYLQQGGDGFASGAHTDGWRSQRAKAASRPGLATQYIDEPLTGGDYAPVALRTADGGACVFFTTRYYARQTAAAGTTVPTPGDSVRALTKGEIKQSLTMTFVSNQIALDPAKGAAEAKVSVLGRIEGLTAAEGS